MKKNKSFKEKSNKFLKEWWGIIFIAFIAMLTILIFGYFYFSKHSLSWLSGEVEELGQMGDFFGGTLNPILAFLSFCLLLITIKLQSKELKNSRKELSKSSKALKKQSKSLKLQNFENTFFKMLDLHNKTVNELKFTKMKFIFYDFEEDSILYDDRERTESTALNAISDLCNDLKNISDKYYQIPFNKIYDSYYKNYKSILNKYLYTVEQIFTHIYSYPLSDNEKIKYANIYKAQFSQGELKLLFYSCVSNHNMFNLKKYIEELKFFDSLIIEKNNFIFIYILNKCIYSNPTFGYNYLSVSKLLDDVNDYFKNVKLNPNGNFNYKEYLEFSKYCCSVEQYNLAIKKWNERKQVIEEKINKYPNSSNINELKSELDNIKITIERIEIAINLIKPQ